MSLDYKCKEWAGLKLNKIFSEHLLLKVVDAYFNILHGILKLHSFLDYVSQSVWFPHYNFILMENGKILMIQTLLSFY